MAKTDRLTALKVARVTAPGMYADGGRFYLPVSVDKAMRVEDGEG
jgi:hypothetical protein